MSAEKSDMQTNVSASTMKKFGLEKVFVHAFTDGRDVDPKSGALYLEDLNKYINNTNVYLFLDITIRIRILFSHRSKQGIDQLQNVLAGGTPG